MRLRNGPSGYGLVTKLLHWVTVVVIATQFFVGYTMDDDADVRERECEPSGEAAGGGETSEAQEERLDRREEECEQRQDAREDRADEDVWSAFDDLKSGDLFADGVSKPDVHVLLGLLIIGLGLVRVLWRVTTPLPPWADALSPAERRLEGWLEKALITLLFVVPGTGLLLVTGQDDWLRVHITAHILFFVTVGLHIGLVLKHTILQRDRQLQRML